MSFNLKLIFVPVWLERVLEACNESLATALEPEKLTRILSKADLDLYNESQNGLELLLPYEVMCTFRPCVAKLDGIVDADLKRGYIYGFLPDTHDLPANPKFRVQLVGYDYVVVTVATDQEEVDNTNLYLMEAIIEILCSVRPLESVAKLPIMSAWLKASAKNSVL